MEKIHFSIHINAPREKVWKTMLEDKTYREWTTVFSPGSYYKGDWKKGSKILFLGPGQEHQGEGGRVSRIAENIPNEFISIEHLGEVVNGVEDTTSEKVKQWNGAHEDYTFKDANGGTDLTIDIDVSKEYKDMFNGMWPAALQKLKEIAEK